MPFKDLTPAQREMDKIVKKLNTKITKIAKEFGTESRAYQQIYEILSGYNAAGKKTNRFSLLSGGYTRETDTGIIQVSRSAKALANYEIKQYLKALQRVEQLPTAAQIKKSIVASYEKANNTKVKGKAAKEAVVQEAMQTDRTIAARLESALAAVYKLQQKYGYEFKAMQDIKKLSKGRFTSKEDLEKMIAAAEEIQRNEAAQVQADLFAGY